MPSQRNMEYFKKLKRMLTERPQNDVRQRSPLSKEVSRLEIHTSNHYGVHLVFIIHVTKSTTRYVNYWLFVNTGYQNYV